VSWRRGMNCFRPLDRSRTAQIRQEIDRRRCRPETGGARRRHGRTSPAKSKRPLRTTVFHEILIQTRDIFNANSPRTIFMAGMISGRRAAPFGGRRQPVIDGEIVRAKQGRKRRGKRVGEFARSKRSSACGLRMRRSDENVKPTSAAETNNGG
jgi:hypothetical protein